MGPGPPTIIPFKSVIGRKISSAWFPIRLKYSCSLASRWRSNLRADCPPALNFPGTPEVISRMISRRLPCSVAKVASDESMTIMP